MILESFAHDWALAQTDNSTATSFSALLATITKPARSATRAVFALEREGVRQGNTIRVMPFGGNDDNDLINQRVTGWNFIKEGADARGIWVPQTVCIIQATLSSTLVGVADEAVIATEFFADTLTLTSGLAILHQGTADVDHAWYEADVSGFELVEITFDRDTGADTQNALVRFDT